MKFNDREPKQGGMCGATGVTLVGLIAALTIKLLRK